MVCVEIVAVYKAKEKRKKKKKAKKNKPSQSSKPHRIASENSQGWWAESQWLQRDTFSSRLSMTEARH